MMVPASNTSGGLHCLFPAHEPGQQPMVFPCTVECPNLELAKARQHTQHAARLQSRMLLQWYASMVRKDPTAVTEVEAHAGLATSGSSYEPGQQPMFCPTQTVGVACPPIPASRTDSAMWPIFHSLLHMHRPANPPLHKSPEPMRTTASSSSLPSSVAWSCMSSSLSTPLWPRMLTVPA